LFQTITKPGRSAGLLAKNFAAAGQPRVVAGVVVRAATTRKAWASMARVAQRYQGAPAVELLGV